MASKQVDKKLRVAGYKSYDVLTYLPRLTV